MKNANVQKAMKVVTIGGAAVLVLGSVVSLTKVKSVKEAIMPAVAILVGISAFKYATAATPVIEKPTA